ncbi:MAG: response regulator [Burkholderiales bacterium]|nr:response regulator [Burkholderiales bacterium]
MATEEHRGSVEAAAPPPAPPRRLGLFGLLTVVLALVLAAVVVVQARQFALLKHTVVYQDDYVVLGIYQVEAEYQRLREQWTRASLQPGGFDRDALQLRYDIWVSRVGLLHNDRTARLMVGNADYEEPLRKMEAFIARADAVLGNPVPKPVDAATLAALQPELDALGAPIHSMSLSASHHVSAQIAERNAAVRQHNQVGLLLTGFLSLLVLAFGLMALRQMRLLRERQRTLVDLTAHLREARQQAEAASDAKSVFLANMSHEIRTPFHGLLGMLSLLRDTGLNARQKDYLRTATESADHLLTILNDVLDMSLLESGRLTLSEEPIDLRELLRDVEALMRPQAQLKSLALHIDADPGVPEKVRADRTRVKQILFNLLNNAVKFSDRGVVVLDLHRATADDGSPVLEFVVTDTGIGMDEATLARLFRRFSQGDESRSRRHGGTGLGLEISRSLARLMGGDVTAKSVPGEGSSFSFRMPLHVVEPAPRPHAAAGTAELATTDGLGLPAGPGPLRVLVAEDHPVNRQYMAALLEGMGHKPHFAGNGLEAVQAIREQHFDIVLMDLHMPVLDGVGATLSIRALPDGAAATVPIIALTADAFAQTRERCLMAGMNDFLAKPVSPERLSAMLRRLFGGTPGEPEPAVGTAEPSTADGTVSLLDHATLDAALRAMPRERLAFLLRSFFEQGPDIVERLRVALRDGQALDLRVNAHAARGAALNFGLSALAQTAQALHEGATHVPAHEIARLIERYEQLLERSREACEAEGLLEALTE